MPPLTKTCPKMVLSDKGGSLCVKDVFAKKFLVPGEIPLDRRARAPAVGRIEAGLLLPGARRRFSLDFADDLCKFNLEPLEFPALLLKLLLGPARTKRSC